MKLLRAAEQVFGDKGYEDASIAEICRTADAALGSFYVYFPDKKAAFVELVDLLGHRLRRELAEAVEAQPNRIEKERAGLLAFFRFLAEHKKLYRIIRQAEFVDEAAYRRYYDRLASGYVAGLRDAMKRGEIRESDAEITSYCLMGIGDFLGMRWMLWEDAGPKTAKRLADAAIDLVTNGLSAAYPAPAEAKGPTKTRASARPRRSSS